MSLANYMVDLAHDEGRDIGLLRLVKLVYIAHGHMLALTGKSVLDPRFDKVEAWKYGPVIPSVYHSFKHYRNNPIQGKAVVMTDGMAFSEPSLKSEDARKICDYVWWRYDAYTDSELVTLLHKRGTPWEVTYEEGCNNEIPDELTKEYYKMLVDMIRDIANGKRS